MSVGLKVGMVAGTPTQGLSIRTGLSHKMVVGLKASREWSEASASHIKFDDLALKSLKVTPTTFSLLPSFTQTPGEGK